MADKLKGLWVFDKVLYDDSLGGIITRFSVDFVSNGQSFKSIAFTMLNGYQNREYTNQINYVNNTDGAIGDGVYAYQAGGWNTAYKTIEITSYYDEVENADNLLKMLQARATFTPWGRDYEIPITTAKGVLLRTAGKSCDRDIVVKPELEELNITENGEYIPTKAGYSKVSVNVASGGETIPEISEPLTLTASKDGAEEGELVVAYNLSEKVALPTGTNKQLGTLTDENFTASNIKSGVNIFGLTGEYEGEGGGGGKLITKITNMGYYYYELTLEIETIGQVAHYYDNRIEKLTTNAKEIGGYAFQSCARLHTVDLTAVESIGSDAFKATNKLETVIIRSRKVPTIPSWTVFQYWGNGYIYVPKDLIEAYKTGTNWSSWANYFRALEDYTIDGTITGELDPTKI